MWAAQEEEHKKAKKDSIITEDPPQLKNSPELGMLLPVEPGLDPSVVIPPPTQTEHKSIKPTIAPTEQLAPEDHSQLKHPPELGMKVPVEPGRNPSVVIPPSTETKYRANLCFHITVST